MTIVAYSLVPELRGHGRERLARTRAAAEHCLGRAAASVDLEVELERDASGLPRARVGTWPRSFVSFSGTRGLAAAGLSRHPVGVDVEWLGRERLRPVRETTYADELQIAGDDARSLIQLWTAKEAILKKLGLGLSGLSRCRLVDREVLDERTHALSLLVDGEPHHVVSRELRISGELALSQGHILSVATSEDAVTFLEVSSEVLA